ncbi:MAG: tRNA pseudouridine(38-40) synthase TruA [Muribaculaceae bacterium]|nr:tRNA pseudouridine(38-40) synthase TruA [Muribaculaceae bacterium]
MRHFMQLSYRGEGFLGWQRQPQVPTVQSAIEDALGALMRQPVAVTGAGRTDAGVNARMMVAHFDAPAPLPPDLVYRLNSMVGRQIAIEKIWPVPDDAHARFDAVERAYRYYCTVGKSPFLYQLAWQAPPHLDFEKMNEAAALLIGRRDFTSFSKLHTQTKTNICDLRSARWTEEAPGLWHFEITADRFLRNMVRAVVGTLVDVGRGKMPPEAISEIVERKDRCSAGTSMPGHALYLWRVAYPPGLVAP